MQWYLVTKNIGGRPYHYRQRTYREGGKIRTQCKYVGPASDNSISSNPSSAVGKRTEAANFPNLDVPDLEAMEPGQFPIDWSKSGNPFWPTIRRMDASGALRQLKQSGISISAMKGEYSRVSKQIDHLGFDSSLLANIRLLEGKKAGWKRKGKSYEVSLRRSHLPRALEKQLGKQAFQKMKPYKPGTWRDEAANLIADVIQRGYKPSILRADKERSKAKTSAKRALIAYRKLGPIERFTKKGRKKWQSYKKHEAKFLLAHHKKSRLEMLSPFLADFQK